MLVLAVVAGGVLLLAAAVTAVVLLATRDGGRPRDPERLRRDLSWAATSTT